MIQFNVGPIIPATKLLGRSLTEGATTMRLLVVVLFAGLVVLFNRFGRPFNLNTVHRMLNHAA